MRVEKRVSCWVAIGVAFASLSGVLGSERSAVADATPGMVTLKSQADGNLWGISATGPVAVSTNNLGEALGPGKTALVMPLTVTNLPVNGGAVSVTSAQYFVGEFDIPKAMFVEPYLHVFSDIPTPPDPNIIDFACHLSDISVPGDCVVRFTVEIDTSDQAIDINNEVAAGQSVHAIAFASQVESGDLRDWPNLYSVSSTPIEFSTKMSGVGVRAFLRNSAVDATRKASPCVNRTTPNPSDPATMNGNWNFCTTPLRFELVPPSGGTPATTTSSAPEGTASSTTTSSSPPPPTVSVPPDQPGVSLTGMADRCDLSESETVSQSAFTFASEKVSNGAAVKQVFRSDRSLDLEEWTNQFGGFEALFGTEGALLDVAAGENYTNGQTFDPASQSDADTLMKLFDGQIDPTDRNAVDLANRIIDTRWLQNGIDLSGDLDVQHVGALTLRVAPSFGQAIGANSDYSIFSQTDVEASGQADLSALGPFGLYGKGAASFEAVLSYDANGDATMLTLYARIGISGGGVAGPRDIFGFADAVGRIVAQTEADAGGVVTMAASLEFTNPGQAALAERLTNDFFGDGSSSDTLAQDLHQLYIDGSARITVALQSSRGSSVGGVVSIPIEGIPLAFGFTTNHFDPQVTDRYVVAAYAKDPGSTQLRDWTNCGPRAK
jgi:hypothetical protein